MRQRKEIILMLKCQWIFKQFSSFSPLATYIHVSMMRGFFYDDMNDRKYFIRWRGKKCYNFFHYKSLRLRLELWKNVTDDKNQYWILKKLAI